MGLVISFFVKEFVADYSQRGVLFATCKESKTKPDCIKSRRITYFSLILIFNFNSPEILKNFQFS